MITARLKIGDRAIEDTYDKWGFIYKDSDRAFESPVKSHDKTSYAEQQGENIDPRTVQDAFDYKIEFIIEAPNMYLKNVNAKIAKFNEALYSTKAGSDIRTYKQVELYHHRVKIVGIPEPISEAKDFFRHSKFGAMECAVVEWKIRVSNPKLCNFNLGRIPVLCTELGCDFLLESGATIQLESSSY